MERGVQESFPRAKEVFGTSPSSLKTQGKKIITIVLNRFCIVCKLNIHKERMWYTTTYLLCKQGHLVSRNLLYRYGESRHLFSNHFQKVKALFSYL